MTNAADARQAIGASARSRARRLLPVRRHRAGSRRSAAAPLPQARLSRRRRSRPKPLRNRSPATGRSSPTKCAAGGSRWNGRRRQPFAAPRTLPGGLVCARTASRRRAPTRTRRPACSELADLRDGVKGKAFYFDDNDRGDSRHGVGYYERTQPFSIDLWVKAAQVYEDAARASTIETENAGNAGYQLHLEKNHLRSGHDALARGQHDPRCRSRSRFR